MEKSALQDAIERCGLHGEKLGDCLDAIERLVKREDLDGVRRELGEATDHLRRMKRALSAASGLSY